MPNRATFVARVLPPCASNHETVSDAMCEFTHEEAVALNLAGLPLCIEHNDNLVVGTVVRDWMDDDGSKMILGEVVAPDFAGQCASAGLDSKWLAGVSLAHNASMHVLTDADNNTRLIIQKHPIEVSLCHRGKRDNTEVLASVTVACSKTHPDYKPTTVRTCTVACSDLFMASDTGSAVPASVSAPAPAGDAAAAPAPMDAAPAPMDTSAAPVPAAAPPAAPADLAAGGAAEAPPRPGQPRDAAGRYANVVDMQDAQIQQLAEANKHNESIIKQLQEANEAFAAREAERQKEAEAAAEERARAAAEEMERTRLKSQSMLQTMEQMYGVGSDQINALARMLTTDPQNAAQAIEIACECSRRSHEKVATLQATLRATSEHDRVMDHYAQRYQDMCTYRASAGIKRPLPYGTEPAPDSKPRAAKVAASGRASPLPTPDVAGSSEPVAMDVTITRRFDITPASTYTDCNNALLRVMDASATALGRTGASALSTHGSYAAHMEHAFAASAYNPGVPYHKRFPFSLLHTDPDLFNLIAGPPGTSGGTISAESARASVVQMHYAASRRRM